MSGAQADVPERPKPSDVPAWLRWADRYALAAMALGVALMLQPWWQGGFRAGFLMTLHAVVLQIVTARLVARSRSRAEAHRG